MARAIAIVLASVCVMMVLAYPEPVRADWWKDRKEALEHGLADFDQWRIRLMKQAGEVIINMIGVMYPNFTPKQPGEAGDQCASRAHTECDNKFKQQQDVDACAAQLSQKCN